jgi:flagellar motor switch/type III secretory pathway protein FliN
MPDATASSSYPGNPAEAPANAGSALLLRGEAQAEPKVPSGPNPRPFPEGSPLATLPMQLDVTVPIPSFRVKDLLALEMGAVLESRWSHTDDIPVWCGGVQLVWTEFEVLDHKLAVRITRLG